MLVWRFVHFRENSENPAAPDPVLSVAWFIEIQKGKKKKKTVNPAINEDQPPNRAGSGFPNHKPKLSVESQSRGFLREELGVLWDHGSLAFPQASKMGKGLENSASPMSACSRITRRAC